MSRSMSVPSNTRNSTRKVDLAELRVKNAAAPATSGKTKPQGTGFMSSCGPHPQPDATKSQEVVDHTPGESVRESVAGIEARLGCTVSVPVVTPMQPLSPPNTLCQQRDFNVQVPGPMA